MMEDHTERNQKVKKWLADVFLNNSPIFLLTAYCLLLTLQASADELKDVKRPVNLPEPPWLLIFMIIAAAAVVIIGIWYWLRRKNTGAKPAVIKSPWGIAYQRLWELRQRDLIGQGKFKEHFIELSDIIRKYIEGRFNIHAPEMTTEEFLGFVKNSPLMEVQYKELLKNFLRLADMVKFAKYDPSPNEAAESFELVKRFVDETKMPTE